MTPLHALISRQQFHRNNPTSVDERANSGFDVSPVLSYDPKAVKMMIASFCRAYPTSDMEEYSFSNYHTHGLDYLCLFRSEHLTVKAYFIDENTKFSSTNGEGLVDPHNHMYDFTTYVLKGNLWNILYKPEAVTEQNKHREKYWELTYHASDRSYKPGRYQCVLSRLATFYPTGTTFSMEACWPHTIAPADITEPVILLQLQFANTTVRRYSNLYRLVNKAPSIRGLYKPMTVSKIRARTEQLITTVTKGP